MTSELPGLFITLEGIEGVGKSTCLKFISKYLQRKNISFITTREPGGTPFAEEIRNLLLHHHDEPVESNTELLLLFAARAQHLSQVILPALQNGQWVISDRFTEATYAYQGGGRNIPEKKISILENLVQDNFRPDLILLLDAPVTKALRRTHRRKQKDRIEQEKENFFRKVRRTYLQRAEAHPKRYRIVNAAKSLSYVKRELQEILDPFIEQFVPSLENNDEEK
jgi:dTMP kinase